MQFQPDIDHPTTDRLPHPTGLAFGHAVDHHIIREPLELNARILPDHPEVEAIVQKDVGDQRGDRTPLRGPFHPGQSRSVGHQHRGRQPALHVQQDPSLVRVTRHSLEHQLPRNGIEEGPHVQVYDPVLLETPFPAHPYGVHRGTPRPVPVRIVVEHPLRVRLHDEHRHRLGHPVDHIRDAEDPGPTLLGYLHRPDRPGEIASRRHAVPQFVEVVLHVHLELLDRHAVGPGRSAVPLHLEPRIPHQ